MAEAGATTETMMISCPDCEAEVTVHFVAIPDGVRDGELWVQVRATRATGCAHADAWTRGPDDDGDGEPMPVDLAA